ncbi:uncharacterized protein LOC131672355 isoform X6 [Phymastichus coffea]|uniref:uncharacterized protein LOC131672355 isoform X6 n=1 Tax=Phymastichus coffea TaxID=108790 RepID=UPI00273AB35A|nr:uncharacterized protein LOC131672355 isoform X6 [Phymastichus coffea]
MRITSDRAFHSRFSSLNLRSALLLAIDPHASPSTARTLPAKVTSSDGPRDEQPMLRAARHPRRIVNRASPEWCWRVARPPRNPSRGSLARSRYGRSRTAAAAARVSGRRGPWPLGRRRGSSSGTSSSDSRKQWAAAAARGRREGLQLTRTARCSQKVRKITAESGGGASAGGARQQRPRNSADGGGGGGGGGAVLQSSSASAAGRNATGRAASPVLSQSGRRQAAPPRSRSPSPSTRGPAGQPAPAPTSLLAGLLRRQRRAAEPAPAPLGPQPRKCVSFGADAAERPRAATGRPRRPAHEARLYRKGVLQDRQSRGSREAAADDGNLPLSWEECLGGPRALLGAAHDADDELVQRIVNLANKAGLGNIQLNAQDNSGRTAISYLAGNGSALVLEACLALPGCDANLADNEGNAPLHFAAQAGRPDRVPQHPAAALPRHRGGRQEQPRLHAAHEGRPPRQDQVRQDPAVCRCQSYAAGPRPRAARGAVGQVLLQLVPVPPTPVQAPPPAGGLRSKIRRVFRTTSNTDKTSFSLVSQLTSAALCASSPVLPKPGDVSPAVKSLLRPLSVPQLRITLVAPQDVVAEKTPDKCSHGTTFTEKIESTMVKPPRTKKNSK